MEIDKVYEYLTEMLNMTPEKYGNISVSK